MKVKEEKRRHKGKRDVAQKKFFGSITTGSHNAFTLISRRNFILCLARDKKNKQKKKQRGVREVLTGKQYSSHMVY